MATIRRNMFLLSRMVTNSSQQPFCCFCRKNPSHLYNPVKLKLNHSVKSYSTNNKNVKKRGLFRKVGRIVVYGAVGYWTIRAVESWVKVGDPLSHTKNSTIELYRKMPLKAMSRAWGKFNQFDLPVLLRRPLLGLYIWMFGCKLEEASDEELRNYKNLGEFFRRTLKPHVRKIDKKHPLTSPADGKILHYGVVKDGILEQVKGVVYSLRGFLGPLSWMNNTEDVNRMTDQEYYNKMNIKPGHKLYHCVIYLSPGDYHRFHSASDWTINYRRHFPGELLSVSPVVARWIQGLFNFNERVVYTGSWKHGFFSYTAVGATNVGSIKIYCDQELTTNTGEKHCDGVYYDKCMTGHDNDGINIKKGEMFGEFNLGSTIVLIFEAPDNFKFEISQGQKVKFGQPFGLSN